MRREKLIGQITRSNPLRRIVDESHAASILAAHDRHTFTNYEVYLKDAHELEEEGVISKGHAKEYAYARIKNEDSSSHFRNIMYDPCRDPKLE